MNRLLQRCKSFGLVCLIGVCYGQSFTVSVSPASLTIYPGQQNVPVTVTVGNSAYTGPIVVTLTGLPSGMYVSPLQLLAGTSGTLNLSASVSAAQEDFPTDGPTMITSWTTSATVVGAAGANMSTAPLSLTISISNPAFAPAASNIDLPVVRIDTNNAPILSKTTDTAGNMTITSADGKTTYLPNASDADNTANFHIHGDSTAAMPKLAYHVKLNTSLDLLNALGLQCPYVTNGKGAPACDKSKSFILLANYDDKTLLRDWSASALANAIPIGNGYLNSPADSPTPSGTAALMPWAPHSLFVELYLNGMYEGNYQLIEEVKVDSHRINITELSEADTAPAAITGGYLLEIDQHQNEAFVFTTLHNLPIGLIDPDFTPDPEVAAQTNYIMKYVDNAETALFASNFTDPTLGWRAYFDETSAIDFYIVNDVMGNVDGGDFYSSDYLYKDANNPLLYMGPIWDFDISSGNVNYDSITSPVAPWMQTQAVWYAQWFTDPGFKADLVTQWNALKKNGVFTKWLISIQQEAAALQQSQINNFGRWPMQGIEVWPNPQAGGNYAAEVAYLTNWLSLRIAYLDSLFNNKTQTSIALNPVAAAPRSGSPLTLSAQVSGGNSPAGTVTFLSNFVLLGTAPLTAGGAATLITDSVTAGPASLQAVYSGDNNNALAVSQAQTVPVASPFLSTVTSVGGNSSSTSGSTNTAFTASVIANSGTAMPSGTLTFSVDSAAGTGVALNANGTASFTPASLSSGTHTVTASYSGDANYSASAGGFTTATVTVTPGGGFPTISAAVNAASGAQALPQVVAPGSYVTIYGSGLAGTGTPSAVSLPLLTTLDGTQVTIGGMAMPLLYAGSAQINALVPQGLAPNVSYPVVVTVGSIQSLPLTITVTELQPGIYTRNLSGSSAGVVANSQSGIANSSSNPANVGDYLTVYCTGLGALTGANGEAQPADGAAAPASPIFHTTATVTATVGGIAASVSFAGLAPTFAGLYQVNLQVPAGVPSGDSVALVLTAIDLTTGAAGQSNVVTIAIQ